MTSDFEYLPTTCMIQRSLQRVSDFINRQAAMTWKTRLLRKGKIAQEIVDQQTVLNNAWEIFQVRRPSISSRGICCLRICAISGEFHGQYSVPAEQYRSKNSESSGGIGGGKVLVEDVFSAPLYHVFDQSLPFLHSIQSFVRAMSF